jgi:multidrug efflux pump subunit AcrA (membrane-fusion protein)
MKKLIVFTSLVLLFSCNKSKNEGKPEYREITETVFASGILEPEDKYNLTAQSEGYITVLNFKEGDIVKTNDVLAAIDNQQNVFNEKAAAQLLGISQVNVSENAPAIKQTEAALDLAKEKLKQDELQVNRYKKLLESNSVSKLEYENTALAYENSKANVTNLQQTLKLQKQQAEQQLINQNAQKDISSVLSGNNEVKAVVGGKVYNKMKEIGDYVRRGDVIAVIGNANNVYAKVNVDESNIAKIKVGQKAVIQLNTNKGLSYDGTLYELLPAFDDASQSFICKIKFEKEPELKISGTQLQANIIIGNKKRAFVIPRAFLDYGNKVRVKGKDEPVVVKTGFVSSDWVEVTEGLSENDILLPLIK